MNGRLGEWMNSYIFSGSRPSLRLAKCSLPHARINIFVYEWIQFLLASLRLIGAWKIVNSSKKHRAEVSFHICPLPIWYGATLNTHFNVGQEPFAHEHGVTHVVPVGDALRNTLQKVNEWGTILWTNGWRKERVNKGMNKWIIERMSEWLVGWTIEWINRWANEWMNERMHEWRNDSENHWTNGCVNGWKHEWMNECMNDWKDGRSNEGMNECMNEWRTERMNECRNKWMRRWRDKSWNR